MSIRDSETFNIKEYKEGFFITHKEKNMLSLLPGDKIKLVNFIYSILLDYPQVTIREYGKDIFFKDDKFKALTEEERKLIAKDLFNKYIKCS